MEKRIGRTVKMSLAVLAVLALTGLAGKPAGALDKLETTLDWIVYGKHAGFFAGIDTGIYRKHGLDVSILRGYGSADTIKRVGAKSSTHGFADFGSLVIARSKDVKTKMLAVIHTKSLMTLMTLRETGIRTPKGLEGKRVGIRKGGAVSTVLPALLAKNRVDDSKIEWINMTPEALIPSLVSGKIDVSVDTFMTEFPTVQAKAREMKKEAYPILFSDFGVDLLSNGLLVHDDTLASHPDRTRRWVEATMRSFEWAAKNSDEALKIFLKYAPAIDPKLARAHWDIAVKHLLVPEAKTHGIGYMLPERVAYAIDLLTDLMKLPRKVSTGEVVDMGFLPKIIITQ